MVLTVGAIPAANAASVSGSNGYGYWTATYSVANPANWSRHAAQGYDDRGLDVYRVGPIKPKYVASEVNNIYGVYSVWPVFWY